MSLNNFIFVLALVLSGFDVPIIIGSVDFIKPIYIVFCFSLLLAGKTIKTNKIMSKFFYMYLVYILIFFIIRVISNSNLSSSFIYLSHFFIYSFISISLYSYGRKIGLLKLLKLLKLTILVYVFLLGVDLITMPFGISIYGLIMGSETYRFGQLFSSEPNWLTVHFITLCILFFMSRKIGHVNVLNAGFLAVFSIGIDLFLNSSRAALVLLAGLAPVTLKRHVFIIFSFLGFVFLLFLLAGIFVFKIDFVSMLPYDMTYDIISIEKNPRINDVIHIVPQIAGQIWLGIGYGDLNTFTESMSWRESYPVVNQMWLQILGMSGAFGIMFWLGMIFKVSLCLSGFYRYFFLLYFMFMQLHNSMFMPISYIAFALLVLVSSYADERSQSTTVAIK